jgi:hypothetical protein
VREASSNPRLITMLSFASNIGLLRKKAWNSWEQALCLRLHFKRLAGFDLAGELLCRFAPASALDCVPASSLRSGSEQQLATKARNNEFPHNMIKWIGRIQELKLPST